MRRIIWLALLTGCSGAPFTLIDDVQRGDADVLPDVGLAIDSSRMDALVAATPDGGGDGASDAASTDVREENAPVEAQGSVDTGRPPDSSVLDGPIDHGEAAVDAVTPDAAVEATISDACIPPATFTFGCGPPIYVSAPTQYCVLNQGPDTAQVMSNPCECEYDCACLLVSGARLCPGGETYQSCSIGTTGGMVVVCK